MNPADRQTCIAELNRLDYSESQVTDRFALVMRAILNESPEIRTLQFEVISNTDLARLFALYDRHFFEGWLARTIDRSGVPPVQFRLSSRMTTAAGKTFANRYREQVGGQVVVRSHYEIAVSTFLLFQAFRDDLVPGSSDQPVTVVGVVCRTRLEALLRIFEHELMHLAEFLAFEQSSCAAPRFHSLSRAIFGHQASVHAMMTPVELAATVHSIRRGDRVAFHHGGVERIGVVNRITKRATVLVPDQGGLKYSDGGTYLSFLVPLDQLRKVGAGNNPR